MDTDASAMKRSEESEVRMVHNVEAALTEKIGLWSPRNACMEQKKTYSYKQGFPEFCQKSL